MTMSGAWSASTASRSPAWTASAHCSMRLRIVLFVLGHVGVDWRGRHFSSGMPWHDDRADPVPSRAGTDRRCASARRRAPRGGACRPRPGPVRGQDVRRARRRDRPRRGAGLRHDHRARPLAAEGLPNQIVYAGLSLGVCRRSYSPRPAGRPGCATAALLRPAVRFGSLVAQCSGPDPPDGRRRARPGAQEQVEAARGLAATVTRRPVPLFRRPHLFTDDSLRGYDERASCSGSGCSRSSTTSGRPSRERVSATADRRTAAGCSGQPLGGGDAVAHALPAVAVAVEGTVLQLDPRPDRATQPR